MTWESISSFFGQSVPFFIVWIIVYQAIMSRDLKHLKELLSNHVTDTNKKIDKLETSTNEKINELKAGFKELETSTNEKFDELKNSTNEKIDELKTEFKELKTEFKEFKKEVGVKFDKILEKLSKKD